MEQFVTDFIERHTQLLHLAHELYQFIVETMSEDEEIAPILADPDRRRLVWSICALMRLRADVAEGSEAFESAFGISAEQFMASNSFIARALNSYAEFEKTLPNVAEATVH